jgi:hypothetical protein
MIPKENANQSELTKLEKLDGEYSFVWQEIRGKIRLKNEMDSNTKEFEDILDEIDYLYDKENSINQAKNTLIKNIAFRVNILPSELY